MSNNSESKGVFIGAGWNKTSKSGNKFISARGGNEHVKLYAVDSKTGEQFEVSNFSIFKNKSDERKEKSPDYYLVYFPQE